MVTSCHHSSIPTAGLQRDRPGCYFGDMSKRKRKAPYLDLGSRERQIVESLYRRGEATVREVLEDLPDSPSYSTVRTMLGKLERKGVVLHRVDGPRYVYRATAPRDAVQVSAMRRIVRNLFDGSAERTVATVLDEAESLTAEELDRIEALIERKRRERRRRERKDGVA